MGGGLAAAFGLRKVPLELGAAPAAAASVQAWPAQSLVASGGICTPLTPFYEISQRRVHCNGTIESLIRDALPTFSAPRGGVAFKGNTS